MSPVVKTRLSGAAVLAFGIAAAILARRLPAQTGFGLGPAFLPFWTGLILAGSGLWLLARPRNGADLTVTEFGSLGRAAAGFVILLLYTLALEPLGYVISTVGFLIGTAFLVSPNHPARVLFVALGGTFFLVLVFRLWLRIPLPGGVVGW